jgi:AcrR family transcriptional regulator
MSMRLPAEQRRRQLLDVSLDVFAERGFHATSMDDVALAAGVTKPVLYQHFPNKRGLFTELLDDVGHQLLVELIAATSSASNGREQVERGFEAYFTFVGRRPAAFRLLFGASVRNDEASNAISALIVIEGSDAHRDVLAHALVGIAEAVARYALTDGEPLHDSEQLARWVSQMTWSGLRGVTPDEHVRAAELGRSGPSGV